MEADSALDEENLRVPTNLTQVACDLALRVTGTLANVGLAQNRADLQQKGEDGQTLLPHLGHCREIVRVLQSWNDAGRRQLYFEALKEVDSTLDKISAFIDLEDSDEQPKNLFVACYALHLSWVTHGPSMMSDHAEASTKKLKKSLLSCVGSRGDGEFNAELRKVGFFPSIPADLL